MNTIAAEATAPGAAGVGIIRISGSKTLEIIAKIFQSDSNPAKQPRKLIYGVVKSAKTQQVIDKAMLVYFPTPNSFTGEDVAEIQTHGSPVIIQNILQELYRLGATPPQPGEFTRRAYMNGKLDLLQAEAVGDLISANSEAAARVALENLSGKFSSVVDDLGEPLRNILAELEAYIDFPDEDIEPDAYAKILADIKNCQKRITDILKTFNYGQILKTGYRVLICGRPNAGKSSLLNSLLGTQRAIVSDIAGTTRDLIEEQASFGGYSFVLCDSAGLAENSSDQIEKIGIELALDRLEWAQAILLVASAESSKKEVSDLLDYLSKKVSAVFLVVNKTDLQELPDINHLLVKKSFKISVKEERGLEDLKQALVDAVISKDTSESESGIVITNQRQQSAFQYAEEYLQKATTLLEQNSDLELIAADLRAALFALNDIIGVTSTEDILGRIFGKFCIGK